MTWSGIRRKVFISHYRGDSAEVDMFINEYSKKQNVFIPYVLGANDNDSFIQSTNPQYVMSQIRERYLQDTTVTIVLVGGCSHSRRYIDWEIKSSLRQGEYTPNGLIGIVLKSRVNSAILPPRFADNWNNRHVNCYARYWVYPNSADLLGSWIDDAYESRVSRSNLIVNSQDMMRYNRECKECNRVH